MINNCVTSRSLECGWCNACENCRQIDSFRKRLRSEGLALYRGKCSVSASFNFNKDSKTMCVEFYLKETDDNYLAKYRVMFDDIKNMRIPRLMDEVVFMLERNL